MHIQKGKAENIRIESVFKPSNHQDEDDDNGDTHHTDNNSYDDEDDFIAAHIS